MSDRLEVIAVTVEFDALSLTSNFTRPEDVGPWVVATLGDLLARYQITQATRIVVRRVA